MKRTGAAEKITMLLESKSTLFDTRTLCGLWHLKKGSAKVEAFRMMRAGILRPVRRGIYQLAAREPSSFELANYLYQPSMVSLESALNHWGVVAQVPQSVSSIAGASKQIVVQGTAFVYRRAGKELLGMGTVCVDGGFVAQPQKALMDYLYFVLKGIYAFNEEDFFLSRKMDWGMARQYLPFYPPKFQKSLEGLFDTLLKRRYDGVR